MATLKISDLSIGDYVCYCDMVYKVDSIEESGLVRANNKSYSCPHIMKHIDYIDPIPITAEILEKNGWSNDGMYAFLRIDEHRHLEYYYHEHRLRKYYCGVDEWQNHAKVNNITFAVHCYSVHQLQHALRLAGADKEINL